MLFVARPLTWVHDLDSHLAPGGALRGAVNLGERGDPDRLGVEVVEQGAEWGPNVILEHCLNGGNRTGSALILQRGHGHLPWHRNELHRRQMLTKL